MDHVIAGLKGWAAAVALAAILSMPAAAAAQSPVGVWRVTHWKNANGEGVQIQPAYTAYFPNGYFVIMWEASDGPRPSLPENPTAAEQHAAWQPLVAQFGTYTVSGSDITYTVLVSKNPASMREGGNTYTRGFTIQGNTMTTNGPTSTYTYARVR
jgi:hypothetical protein